MAKKSPTNHDLEQQIQGLQGELKNFRKEIHSSNKATANIVFKVKETVDKIEDWMIGVIAVEKDREKHPTSTLNKDLIKAVLALIGIIGALVTAYVSGRQ